MIDIVQQKMNTFKVQENMKGKFLIIKHLKDKPTDNK